MLRRDSFARLAFQHSPEKEQRLIKYGATEEAEENLSPGKKGRGIGSLIGRIKGLVKGEFVGVVPELVISQIPHIHELFDLLEANGILEGDIENSEEYKAAKAENRELTQTEKESIIARILNDPVKALSVVRAIEMERERYEEILGIIQKNLHLLGIKDLAGVEDILRSVDLENPKSQQEYDRRILEKLGDAGPIKRRLLELHEKAFHHPGENDTYIPPTDEDLDRGIVKCVQDAALKVERKRQLFGRRPETTDQESWNNRQKYLDTLREQDIAVKRAMDASLQTALEKERRRIEALPARTDADEQSVIAECIDRIRSFIRPNAGKKARALPLPESPEYMDCVRNALYVLENSRHLEPDLKAAKEEGEEIDEFASSLAERLQELDTTKLSQLDDDQMEHITRMREMYLPYLKDEMPAYHRWSVRSMGMDTLRKDAQTLAAIEAIPNLGPRMREAIERAGLLENTEGACQTLQERLQQVSQELPQYLGHPVCTTLGITERLRQKQFNVSNLIAVADEHRAEERGTRAFQSAAVEVGELEEALKLLRGIWNDPELIHRVTGTEYQAATGGYDSYGHYDFSTGTIVINSEKLAETGTREDIVIAHERGHAILDILTRRTGVFPGLLIASHLALNRAAEAQGLSIEDMSERLSDAWMIPKAVLEGDMGRDAFMHELLSHYGDWRTGRKQRATPEERRLFELLQGRDKNEEESEGTAGQPLQLHMADDGGFDEMMAAGAMDEDTPKRLSTAADEDTPRRQPTEEKEVLDPGQELKNIEWAIGRIESFLKAYPQYNQDPNIIQWFPQLKDALATCKVDFTTGRHNTEEFGKKLQWTKDLAKDFDDAIKQVDLENMDLTHVPKSTAASLWMRFTSGVEWLSISDVIAMFHDMKEDIMRMWKRRSESARSRMGEHITSLIPDAIPYLGWLKHDFRGRDKASEQEEVGVWEKRYEKIDSDRLLEMLGQTTRKDQVKAIVNLLSNRGRMDFDHKPFWTTLERLSRYSMPHGPCSRDNLLRNTYLQKLIADIWGEKDLFEHWKTTNDGGIKKGKDSFQATCDDLSNVSGGLAGMLQRLLENRIKEQKSGATILKEEEINPHLYEQVLNYSMRNGKMTMEQKFFYLIQGVAHGIMNVDRLRGFTGEQGGVLMQFPFIDYFTGKNNTLPEIIQLAVRLGGAEIKKPDYRTTYFLYEEVLKNKSAQDRMSKALKVSQTIDHEDIPMYVGQLDFKNINHLVAFYSGSLWKTSPPALKNGYVGYNTFFQYFAARSKMFLANTPGAKPLTISELKKISTILAAFVHYDNIVTCAADVNRPSLSWNEINNTTPVSGGSLTSVYRNNVTRFASNTAHEFGITEIDGLAIDKVIGADRKDATGADSLTKEDRAQLAKDQTPEKLEAAFARALTADPTRAMRFLAQYAEHTGTDHGFTPESDKFTYGNITQLAQSWA